MNTWDSRFMEFAKQYSTFSKDPSRKIGAVAVDPFKKIILSGGYNGFPRGIVDTPRRLNDRPTKYKYVVHAEMNMIFNACHSGISLDNSHIYVYGLPVCSECAKGLIQIGAKKIICRVDEEVPETWAASWKNTCDMLDEAEIEYEFIS